MTLSPTLPICGDCPPWAEHRPAIHTRQTTGRKTTLSIVRITWALISAAYAATMLLCLVVTARAVSGELATQLALQAQPVAEQLAQELAHAVASQPGAGGPSAAAAGWLPAVQQQARAAGWSQVDLHDGQGRMLGAHTNPPARGWTAWLHGGWPDAAARAQITAEDGRALGLVTLTLSTDAAQQAIDRACGALLLAFAVTGGLLLLGLYRVERWARRPLDQFCDQVAGLSERRFVNIPQPRIAEWTELSKSLNVMVARVRQMLEERDEAVGNLKDKLSHDALTQTTSRDTFMASLKAHLRDNEAGGGVAIVRVHDLEGMNRRLGRNRTDEFLVAMATILRTRLMLAGQDEGFMLARLNGADFGLLLPGCDLDGWRTRLEGVRQALSALSDDAMSDDPQVAWIGGSTFLKGESMGDVLVRVDTMVMEAESQQQTLCVTEPSARQHVLAVAQWRVVIETALDTGHLALVTYPVVDAQGRLLHQEAMLRLIDADGQALDAEAFVAPAIRCGRIADLDLKAIGLALTELARTDGSIAVNIAAQSALRPIFQRQLAAMLAAQPTLAPRLSLEVRESNLPSTTARAVAQLCRTVAPHGCRLGIDHFGLNLSALGLLSSQGVAYIKLARRVVDDAATEGPTRAFIGLLVELGRRTGVQVMAGGVATVAAAQALAALGVQGFTGPGVHLGLALPSTPTADRPDMAELAELA